ncbi:uncharacterized protein LOC110857166 [Folsomia candida]|uniref:uncharacterized protein LOC110857166 n=1 Tax=Folsomia candida TaxID=158441 RepID=UPI001604B407|nr:uncharacterized protein LOC110857166 [Folsomia candida]
MSNKYPSAKLTLLNLNFSHCMKRSNTFWQTYSIMKFIIIVNLLLLCDTGLAQTNPADVRIEGYIREKFVQFRDWFVNHGHTGSEHDFSGLRVVNVSATFYDFNSNLSDAKFHIYWPDLRTTSIWSISNEGSLRLEMLPASNPSIVGTHSTSGTDMGNPLTTVGPFNHTYLGFTARLNINYQLVDGYMICDPTPNPSYSTGATRMTRIENLVPSDHLFYRDIMDAYGDQIWVTKYSQDIPRMPGLVATKQFFCEKLAETPFDDIANPTIPPTSTTTMSTTIPTTPATITSSLAPISTTDDPTTTSVTYSSTMQDTTTFTPSTSTQGTGAGVRWEISSKFVLFLTLCISIFHFSYN